VEHRTLVMRGLCGEYCRRIRYTGLTTQRVEGSERVKNVDNEGAGG